MNLQPKQERYCLEISRGIPKGEAAIRAGYSPNTQPALIETPEVAARIAFLTERISTQVGIQGEHVIGELARIALFDPGETIDVDGNLLPLSSMPEHVRKCIQTMELDEMGRMRIRFYDKLKALELLGKYLKLWVERVELSGAVQADVATVMKQARDRAKLGVTRDSVQEKHDTTPVVTVDTVTRDTVPADTIPCVVSKPPPAPVVKVPLRSRASAADPFPMPALKPVPPPPVPQWQLDKAKRAAARGEPARPLPGHVTGTTPASASPAPVIGGGEAGRMPEGGGTPGEGPPATPHTPLNPANPLQPSSHIKPEHPAPIPEVSFDDGFNVDF